MRMATVTAVAPLAVRLWGAESDSPVWRDLSGASPQVGEDVLVTTIGNGLVVVAGGSGPSVEPTVKTWPVVWTQDNGATMSPGSGVQLARYVELGNLVVAWYSITRAADTHIGVGGYRWSLPVPTSSYLHVQGTGSAKGKPCIVESIGGHLVALVTTNDVRVSNTNPGSWAVGDTISWMVAYLR